MTQATSKTLAEHSEELAELRGAVKVIADSTKDHGDWLKKLSEGQVRQDEATEAMKNWLKDLGQTVKDGFRDQTSRFAAVESQATQTKVDFSKTNWGTLIAVLGFVVVVLGLFVDGRTGPINSLLQIMRESQPKTDLRQDEKLDRVYESSVRNDQTLKMLEQGWTPPTKVGSGSPPRMPN